MNLPILNPNWVEGKGKSEMFLIEEEENGTPFKTNFSGG